MADSQNSFEVHFEFPNQATKQAFQRDFQAWVKQEQQSMASQMTGGQQGSTGSGLQWPGQGSSGQASSGQASSGQGERYGYPQAPGLFSVYLNFIPGW
jgi:hypothetical protein